MRVHYMYLHVLSIALPRGCSERNSAAAAVEMMESGDSVRPVSGLNQVFSTSVRSEEHTSELQSQSNLVCRLLLEKKKYRLHSGFYRAFSHGFLYPQICPFTERPHGKLPTGTRHHCKDEALGSLTWQYDRRLAEHR